MQNHENWPQESRNTAVSYGVEISTDDYFVLSQYMRLTDGRTDGHTDVDSKTVCMLRSRTVISDSIVQPQTDRGQIRNISNLDLVVPNPIRDLIYACIILLLFANFSMLKMSHTCTYCLTTIRYSLDASSNVNYFLFCG